MALRGKAKTDYQREYMRKRRGSNNALGVSVRPKQEKLVELRKLMIEPTPLTDVVKPKAPLYRRGFHKQGDLVRMPGSNIEVVVPELDAEFNPVPEM